MKNSFLPHRTSAHKRNVFVHSTKRTTTINVKNGISPKFRQTVSRWTKGLEWSILTISSATLAPSMTLNYQRNNVSPTIWLLLQLAPPFASDHHSDRERSFNAENRLHRSISTRQLNLITSSSVFLFSWTAAASPERNCRIYLRPASARPHNSSPQTSVQAANVKTVLPQASTAFWPDTVIPEWQCQTESQQQLPPTRQTLRSVRTLACVKPQTRTKFWRAFQSYFESAPRQHVSSAL